MSRSPLPALSSALSALAALALLAAPARAGEVVFVDAGAPPGGDGLSWASAFDDLQTALASTRGPIQVWVAEGTYLADPNGDRAATFPLGEGVSLFGGFAGDEQELEERDPEAHPTILSGDLQGDDGPDFAQQGDNTRVIVTAGAGTGPGSIDGFTISGAFNDAELPLGGGVLVQDRALAIRQCRIVGNTTLGSGGAVFASGGGPLTIEDTLIEGNRAIDGFAAAGVFVGGGLDAEITRCRFAGNVTEPGSSVNPGSGGGLHCFHAGLVSVRDCEFEANRALTGGGMLALLSIGITIIDTTFVNNLAVGMLGGGLRLDRSDNPPFDDHPTVIRGCLFLGNEVTGVSLGSAIFATENVLDVRRSAFLGNTAGFSGTITVHFEVGHVFDNCLVAGNTAASLSGLDIEEQAQISITNCTIAHNTSTDASAGAGLFVNESCTADVDNTIFWGNRGTVNGEPVGGEAAQILLFSGTSTLDFSLVEGLSGALGGSGNVGGDPRFADAFGPDREPGTADDDLRLGAGSAAIDAGSNFEVIGEQDLDGNGRQSDDPATPDSGEGDPPLVDMGAYERHAGDLDGDGGVDVDDLVALILAWGPCPPAGPCPADLDGSGGVDVADLVLLVLSWG